MKETGLFITLERFKGYTSEEKLEFIHKMKRHRLMSRQAKAWGYGHNYLSQVYFNLKNEQRSLKKKKVTQKKSTQAQVSLQIEESQQATDEVAAVEEDITETIETMDTTKGLEKETAEFEIRAKAITPDLAIEVVNYFKEKMKGGTFELNLKDSSSGCDLLLVAKEA